MAHFREPIVIVKTTLMVMIAQWQLWLSGWQIILAARRSVNREPRSSFQRRKIAFQNGSFLDLCFHDRTVMVSRCQFRSSAFSLFCIVSHHHGRPWNIISVRHLSHSITVVLHSIRSSTPPPVRVQNPDVPPLAARKISTAGSLCCVLRLASSSSCNEDTTTQQPDHPHRRTRTHSHHVRAASGEETAAAAAPLDPQWRLSHCLPLVRLLFQLLFTLSAVPAFFFEYTRH